MTQPVTVTVEMYLSGAWTDITQYVRADQGIAIAVGIRSEGSVADANEARMVVKNRDGRFSPRNTAGAYYPNLKRNTPLRIKVGSSVRFLGEVSEFPTRWNENGSDVYVPLVASGILRRLQHAKSLNSTLVSAVTYLSKSVGDVKGYWPLEDEQGATSLATGLAGGTPGTFTGSPVFGAVDLGVGTHPVPTWAGASATFTPAPATSTEFTAGFYTMNTTGLTGGEELFRCDVDGTATSWRFIYSPSGGGGVFLQVIANDGATELLASGVLPLTSDVPTFVKVECSNSGSNVAWAFSILPNTGTGLSFSGSISSRTVGAPVSAGIGRGVIGIPSSANVPIGQVVLGSTDTTLFASTFDNGRAGYAGESVDARMARLATENSVTISVTSGATAPAEMGAQPDGALLDVLRASEKADAGGILRDSIGVAGDTAPSLVYITRKARYNDQRSILALDYASKHLSPPLEPTDDDQQLRNDIKANREGGSSARIALTSGALSTAAYPSGSGPYPFEDTYVTYSDAGLPYLASWILRRGTVDETRFPAVTVDLVRNSSLVTDAEAIRPGHRLSISNLPAYAGSASVSLQVLGWTEVLFPWQRTITFVCEPGSPWLVFQLNSSTYGHLDGPYRLAF